MRLFPAITVYTYAAGVPVIAGTFINDQGTGRFTYDPGYLQNPSAYPLDPLNLPLRDWEFETQAEGGFWGCMLDCCPQEWGQRVMAMMTTRMAEAGDPDASAVEREAASDPHNMMVFGSGYGTGALRFSFLEGQTEAMLEPSPAELNSLDLADIRKIAEVHALACDNAPMTPEQRAYLVSGMSLGGARPKAVFSIDGALWIAKFHRARESVDIQRVEHGCMLLARLAGINTAESRIESVEIGGARRTIIFSKRFDRPAGQPLHYLSAASLLNVPRSGFQNGAGRIDPSGEQSRFSYSDIAQVIRSISGSIKVDLEELFRRMAFNVMVGNRDDHMCNHGFILDPETQRYHLSPAFDLALYPNPSDLHAIGIGEQGRIGTVSNVMSRATLFGLKPDRALQILREVAAAVAQWPKVMDELDVSMSDRAWSDALVMKNIGAQLAEISMQLNAPTPQSDEGIKERVSM